VTASTAPGWRIPDLVPVAREIFDRVLGAAQHQKQILREDVDVAADQLLDVRIDGGRVTTAGFRANVDVALRYIESWLQGTGAAAINDLMEDAATAEIARSQLWQWRRHSVTLEDGSVATADLCRTVRAEALARLTEPDRVRDHRFDDAAAILDRLVLDDEFHPFLTLLAYPLLD
jgi:malate synthase